MKKHQLLVLVMKIFATNLMSLLRSLQSCRAFLQPRTTVSEKPMIRGICDVLIAAG